MNRIVARLTRIAFVRRAIAEKADLSPFKQRPSPRVVIGVSTILISYLIGWPLIAALGALSVYLERPVIVLIGGPTVYILSHLMFILGMYLAGARYSWIFLRWLTRKAMLKLMRATNTPMPH